MRLMRFLLLVSLLPVAAEAAQQAIKDPKGGKILAVIVDCDACQNPKKGSGCASGVEAGFHDGKPCGQCLLDANFPTRMLYPYDIHITGRLQGEDGKPLGGRFVKLFLPNTWTVRTKTMDDGFFRLMLGATQPRAGDALVVDLGVRKMPAKADAPHYALYMLPEAYKPCEPKP